MRLRLAARIPFLGFNLFASGIETLEILEVQQVSRFTEPLSLKTGTEDIALHKSTVQIAGTPVPATSRKFEVNTEDLSVEDPTEVAIKKELDPKLCSGDVTGIPSYFILHNFGNLAVRGTKARTNAVTANNVKVKYANGKTYIIYVNCK
jgi:hypothetical protein